MLVKLLMLFMFIIHSHCNVFYISPEKYDGNIGGYKNYGDICFNINEWAHGCSQTELEIVLQGGTPKYFDINNNIWLISFSNNCKGYQSNDPSINGVCTTYFNNTIYGTTCPCSYKLPILCCV